MGGRILLVARCKIAGDTSDVLGRRHQDVDDLQGLWVSVVRDNFDD